MTLKPHAHQEKNIHEIRDEFRKGVLAVLWYLPTGGGKSFAAAFMILTAMETGKTCWFIVHRRELLRQTERQFKDLGIEYGVVAAGRPMQPDKLVQLCSINTLSRRLDKLKRPNLAIVDECHHLPAASWSEVIAKLGRFYMVGLSASPCRLDGRGLGDYFGSMVHGLSIRDLILNGFLSPFKTYAPPTVDTSGLHVRAGDYKHEELEALMDQPSITGSAVSEYQKLCSGKRAIVFCTSIEHSKHVAKQFKDAGYTAAHIDGTTDDQLRDMIISDFEKGSIKILCNVDLCGEGLSINAIECVILLRPTQSLALYIQQVGRGLRVWPGKEYLTILDHVGSTKKFGFIDDQRDWSLHQTAIKQKKKPPPGVRVCPSCFAASPARVTKCVECGHVFEIRERQSVEERQGELVEMTREDMEKARQAREAVIERQKQGMAGIQQLREIARIKGHSPAWADRVIAGRIAKRLKG